MEQKLSKFLIEAFDPRYWLYDLTDGGENVHQFTWPEGPMEKNECSDTIYVNGTQTPYHEHTKGVEVFLISRGHVTATIRNKRTTVDQGDMILIPPYVGHHWTAAAGFAAECEADSGENGRCGGVQPVGGGTI